MEQEWANSVPGLGAVHSILVVVVPKAHKRRGEWLVTDSCLGYNDK